MSTITAVARTHAGNLPVRAGMAAVMALATLYAVTFDNGLLSSALSSSGMFLHELFHDGRHLLGVPCH